MQITKISEANTKKLQEMSTVIHGFASIAEVDLMRNENSIRRLPMISEDYQKYSDDFRRFSENFM